MTTECPNYLVPYRRIDTMLRHSSLSDGKGVSFSYDDLLDIIRHLLMAISFEEDWYCNSYPDVAKAIASESVFSSPAQHFRLVGYFEGRAPYGSSTGKTSLVPFLEIQSMLDVIPTRDGFRCYSSQDDLKAIIRRYLSSVKVDEQWYLKNYPDVRVAAENDRALTAAKHFSQSGYFECRQPFEIKVDEVWYLQTYPDVAEEVRKSNVSSGTDHFFRDGYREGRLPAPDVESAIV